MKLREYQQKALIALKKHNKGTLVIPTGGGKTVIFMEDVKQRILNSTHPLKIVVVAPKILLASQLSNEFQRHLKDVSKVFYFHVHSGENGTTNVEMIRTISNITTRIQHHQIIFTTYKSLSKINESNVNIDIAIFDEAHHSVFEANFVGVAETSRIAKNCYFYTATPRHTSDRKTMANSDVYGGTIISLSPKELVDGGFILAPRVKIKKFDVLQNNELSSEVDCNNIVETIDETYSQKLLVCAKSSKQIMDLMVETNFISLLKDRNFSYMYITSKTGAIVDGIKVSRTDFFKTLNEWGQSMSKKFVVIHRSILSEGISVNGLESVIFLRNMDVIEMTQNIGRVLRKGKESKKFGLCVVPVYSNVGVATEKRINSLVQNMFGKVEIETI